MNNQKNISQYWFMLLYLIPFAFFDSWAEIVRGDMIVFLPIVIFVIMMNTILYKKNLGIGYIALGVFMSYLVSLGISCLALVTIEARHDSYALMPLGVNLYLILSSVVFFIVHMLSFFIMKIMISSKTSKR